MYGLLCLEEVVNGVFIEWFILLCTLEMVNFSENHGAIWLVAINFFSEVQFSSGQHVWLKNSVFDYSMETKKMDSCGRKLD